MIRKNPILFALAGFLLIIGSPISFFICRHYILYGSQPSGVLQTAGVTNFLTDFNNKVKQEKTDSLMLFFEREKDYKHSKGVLTLLSGNKTITGFSSPYTTASADINGSIINSQNNNIVIATILVNLYHRDGTINRTILDRKNSTIIIRIRVTPNQAYKIIDLDSRQLLADYNEFDKVRDIEVNDVKITYDSLTEVAFKSSETLKKRYDSVLWFDHVNGQNYFYVIKGSMSRYFFTHNPDDEKVKNKFKMGLVNPTFKEIIPVEFDLIHNVSGTVEGLVEVEKGDKKGFYNVDGKLIAPAIYDQIFPLKGDSSLALLRKGDDYYYLKKDFNLTAKIEGFTIGNILPKIKSLGESFTLSDSTSKNVMEYNDRDELNSIVIPPSYLVDLQILPKFIDFQNPLRRYDDKSGQYDGSGNEYYQVSSVDWTKNDNNWFSSAFNTVMDSFLGARSGLYETKNVLLVDKRKNRILGYTADNYFGGAEGTGEISGKCNDNAIRSINNNLFEFKTTAFLDQELFNINSQMQEGPYYHYLQITNGKLIAVHGNRIFNCTKFTIMDDSYLNTCYVINDKQIDHTPPEVLQYMKNEIYASYGYKFKNPRWNELFSRRFNNVGTNVNVNDSLTSIEKHNIQWINSILNKPKSNTLAAK